MKIASIIFLLLFTSSTFAELYIWYDENGVKHVSTVPRECLTENKSIDVNCRNEIPSGRKQTISEIKNNQKIEELKARKRALEATVKQDPYAEQKERMAKDRKERQRKYESDLRKRDIEKYFAYKKRQREMEKRQEQLREEYRKSGEIISDKMDASVELREIDAELRRLEGR